MKKIIVFTGGRANYSSTKPIMKAIKNHKNLELINVVSGSAILNRFGNIDKLMEKDGFNVDSKFHMIVEGDNPSAMAKSVGLGVIEMSMILDTFKPDLILVVGDRFDVIPPTISAALMNIPIAHTMGGEVSGTIDESIRHSITKFANLHFPANEDAYQRLIKLGEDPNMIFNVGCPRMDLIVEELKVIEKNKINLNYIFKEFKGVGGHFNLEENNFLLVSQHPVTTEYDKNREYINELLYALLEIKMPTIMLWPNIDSGSDLISKGIRTFREKYKPDWLHLFINLPFEVYLQLMAKTSCLIGNSSSGVRESTLIGTPVVDIGTRQQKRLKGNNLINVNPKKDLIINAIRRQLDHGKYKKENVYGLGNAGELIANYIDKIEFKTTQKIITY